MTLENVKAMSDVLEWLEYQDEVITMVRSSYKSKFESAVDEYIRTGDTRMNFVDELYEGMVDDGYVFSVRVTIGVVKRDVGMKCACWLSDFSWK